MVLYRFLFAPALLAVAVLTTSPRRAPPAPAPVAAEHHVALVSAHEAPVRAARALPSHPASVR